MSCEKFDLAPALSILICVDFPTGWFKFKDSPRESLILLTRCADDIPSEG
jgi:hypothetical protein